MACIEEVCRLVDELSAVVRNSTSFSLEGNPEIVFAEPDAYFKSVTEELQGRLGGRHDWETFVDAMETDAAHNGDLITAVYQFLTDKIWFFEGPERVIKKPGLIIHELTHRAQFQEYPQLADDLIQSFYTMKTQGDETATSRFFEITSLLEADACLNTRIYSTSQGEDIKLISGGRLCIAYSHGGRTAVRKVYERILSAAPKPL